MNDPRRILILTFSYWPMANARAFRWTALAEWWAGQGREVHVVCSWARGKPRYETKNGVHVHRAGATVAESLRGWLAVSRGAAQLPGQFSASNRTRDGFALFANFLREQIWRRIYWPDTACLWYGAARRSARQLLGSRPIDALISVSPSFTAVAVGRSLLAAARTSGRSPMPWLIDLGDPFSFAEEAPANNFALYRGVNRSFERACFRLASAICVTTPGTRQRYAAMFPESAQKLSVIPPLLSLPYPAPGSPARPRPRKGAARFVFVGTLYRTIRRPNFLLALFDALRARSDSGPLELHFYGNVSECDESFAGLSDLEGKVLFRHGVVSREEAAAAVSTADLLVNVGNDTSYQLPSKLPEYVAAGRPILNLAGLPDDSSAQYLSGHPFALTLVTHAGPPTQAEVDAVATLLKRADEEVPPALIERWLAPSRLPVIADAYLRLLGAEPVP